MKFLVAWHNKEFDKTSVVRVLFSIASWENCHKEFLIFYIIQR